MYRNRLILTAALGLFNLFIASAQGDRELMGGIFNSPKGFGISISNLSPHSSASTLVIYADLSDVIQGRNNYPGIKATYILAMTQKQHTYRDGTAGMLFAGPGVSAGYVRDHGRPEFGMMAALSASGGYLLKFNNGIDIILALSADLGIHISKGSDNSPHLGMYKNGLRQAIYPEIIIGFKF